MPLDLISSTSDAGALTKTNAAITQVNAHTADLATKASIAELANKADVSVEGDLATEKLRLNALIASDGERAGDSSRLFTATLTGAPETVSAFGGTVVNRAGYGRVLRVAVSGDPVTIGTVRRHALKAGVVYQVDWQVVRVSTSGDPFGDGVQAGVAYLDATFNSVGVVHYASGQPSAGSAMNATARFASAPAGDIEGYPAGAVYAVPFVTLYGSPTTTDLVEINLRRFHEASSSDVSTALAVVQALAAETAEAVTRAPLFTEASGVTGVEIEAPVEGQYLQYGPDGETILSSVPGLPDVVIPTTASTYLKRNSANSAFVPMSASQVRGDLDLDTILTPYMYGATGLDADVDGAALALAVATGNRVYIPPSLSLFNIAYADTIPVLRACHRITADVPTDLVLEKGVSSISSGDLASIGAVSRNLRIIGAEPVPLAMTSVASITGPAGDYFVTYNVTAPGGVDVDTLVSVGDALKNFQIGPIPLLNGDNVASYVLRNRPLANELMNPITNLGRVTAVPGSSSVTFAGGLNITTNCLVVGDLQTINGQTRVISSVALGANGITGTWDSIGAVSAIPNYITLPNTGTIAISGTALTGDGTLLLSEANVADMVLVDGNLFEITAIASNTAATLRTGETVVAGASFSIVTGGTLHDGIYPVTAVTATTITVRSRNRVKPPINKVVGGSMRVIKTVLQQTGTGDGIKFGPEGVLPWIDRIAVRGPRAGAGVGLLMGGRVAALPLAGDGTTSFGNITQHGYPGACLCGPDFGVFDFYVDAFLNHGDYLDARMAAFSSATGINVWQMGGSFANLRRVVVSGGSGIGHAVNAGAGALITETHYVANVSDGLRRDSGANVYGESPKWWANGGMNCRLIGNGGFGVSQGICVLANGSNFYFDEATAEIDEFIIACARVNNVDAQYSPSFRLHACWITGAGQTNGINVIGGNGGGIDNAVTGNKNINIFGRASGKFVGEKTFSRGAIQSARADEGAKVILPASSLPALQVTANSEIDAFKGVSPTPTLSGVLRFNERTKDGAIIRDGASSAGVGLAGMRIADGSVQTFQKMVTTVFDMASVPAGGQVTFDVTVAGAATTSMVADLNLNSLPTNCSKDANIIAASTVRNAIINNSGSAIDPGNGTYTNVVRGYAA